MPTKELSDYRVMIAIPCLNTVNTAFFNSVMHMQNNGNTCLTIESNSLIYDARNNLTVKAMDAKADYILWIDSDMVFEPDLLVRLLEDALENDADFVTALCFKRVFPTAPTIGKTLYWNQDKMGRVVSGAELYSDYPKDQLFEIACSGLACTLIKVSAIAEAAGACQMSPFQPLPGLSEDYSLCFRLKQIGKKMYCDSRIKVGHIGTLIFNEDTWLEQEAKKGDEQNDQEDR